MHLEQKRSQPADCNGQVPDLVRVEVVSAKAGLREIDGIWQQLSGRVLLLSTSEPVPSSTAVSIEREDVLFIGEVSVCERQAAASWKLRIEVEHKLTNLQGLLRLRNALVDGDFPPSSPRSLCAWNSAVPSAAVKEICL